jgi:magnesium chelatase family protein
VFHCVHLCPCGWLNDAQKACGCASAVVTKYQKRISDPILDRIDTAKPYRSPKVDYEKLSADGAAETSASIRARVQADRDMQTRRFSNNGSSDIVCNADIRVREIRQFCKLPEDGQSLMRAAMKQLNLSARTYHRILQLARTIANLAKCEEIQSVRLAEALHASQSPELDAQHDVMGNHKILMD